MHSRFLEQRTISQGSIYAAPAAWNRRGDGRRSAYPNSFTYFPLSRKYIRVLSPLPFFSTVSWLFHFFSLSFFLWLLERSPWLFQNCDSFSIFFDSFFSIPEQKSGSLYAIFWRIFLSLFSRHGIFNRSYLEVYFETCGTVPHCLVNFLNARLERGRFVRCETSFRTDEMQLPFGCHVTVRTASREPLNRFPRTRFEHLSLSKTRVKNF